MNKDKTKIKVFVKKTVSLGQLLSLSGLRNMQ